MFQGSVFIAMILILRLILLDRLPKRAFTVMWTACTIQLLLPIGQLTQFSYTTIFSAVFGCDLVKGGGEAMRDGVTWILESTPIGTASWTLAMWAARNLPGVSGIHPVACFWSMGAGAFVLFFLIGHLRGRRVYRESLPVDDPFVRVWEAENQDGWRIVSVRVSDRIAAPLTYGIIHPVVLLPRDMDWEDREALSYMLAHEFYHVHRWDALRKLGFAAALCIHWFNPMAWLMYAAANRDLELDCDESTAAAFTWGSREGYARALIAMEERRSFGSPLTSHFSRTALEARVKALLSRKHCGGARLALAGTVVCALALVCANPNAARGTVTIRTVKNDPIAVPSPVPTSEVVEWAMPTPEVVERDESAYVAPGSHDPVVSEYVAFSFVEPEQSVVTEESDIASVAEN